MFDATSRGTSRGVCVMTTGIKGPTGPGGPTGPVGADDLSDSDHVDRTGQADGLGGPDRATGVDPGQPMRALAAQLDAGRVSPEQALAQLLDDMAGELAPGERAELQGLFADLLANDPYLAGLARDLGAAPPEGGAGGGDSGGGAGSGGAADG